MLGVVPVDRYSDLVRWSWWAAGGGAAVFFACTWMIVRAFSRHERTASKTKD